MPTELITSPVDVVGPPELSDYEKERDKPMPSLNHAFVQARLIVAFAASPEFSALPELTLGFPDRDPLIPDIAIYPRLTPDWLKDQTRVRAMPRSVVEIVSPYQGLQDILDKLEVYYAYGVESAWVIQSGFQLITIYLPGQPRPLNFPQGEARDPATGLTVRVEDIFA